MAHVSFVRVHSLTAGSQSETRTVACKKNKKIKMSTFSSVKSCTHWSWFMRHEHVMTDSSLSKKPWTCCENMDLKLQPPFAQRFLRRVEPVNEDGLEFSIVTYNILADMHFMQGKAEGRYQYCIDETKWKKKEKKSFRHNLFMCEVCSAGGSVASLLCCGPLLSRHLLLWEISGGHSKAMEWVPQLPLLRLSNRQSNS